MSRSDEWADYLDPGADDPRLPPEHRDTLDRYAAVLADEAVWTDPPPALRAALLDRVARESRAHENPAARLRTTGPAPVTGTARNRAARAWWVSLGALAAAAAVVAVLAWPRPQPPSPSTTFAMSGTALAPAATAIADLTPKSAGLAITLHVKGLPPAPAGHYYAAWLRGPRGVVPVGTFHWRKGGIPIELWSGVLSDSYPELFVTLQAEGTPPTPSTDVVLTGRAPAGR